MFHTEGKKMSLRGRIAIGLGLIAVLVGIGLPVAAQQNGGSGLSISPTRSEFQIEPGKSDSIKITLKNVSGIDIIAKATINDFESDDATGEPKILPESNKSTGATIRRFVSGVTDVPLKKDEKKDLVVNIDVPTEATPGAYYGIIRYTAVPQGQSTEPGQVALTASVGTLVLIQVPGDITEQIQLQNVTAKLGEKAGTFFRQAPDKVAIQIRNTGNGFSKPFGRIAINNMRGKEVFAYEINSTDPKANILPASSRTFTDVLKNVSLPGRYTIIANISHGSGGEVLTRKVSFWYIPTWLIIIAAVLIVLLVISLYVLYRRRFSRPSRRR
jgi:hypothetical protein